MRGCWNFSLSNLQFSIFNILNINTSPITPHQTIANNNSLKWSPLPQRFYLLNDRSGLPSTHYLLRPIYTKTFILLLLFNSYTRLDYMDNILLMDFELNKPLTYLNKFKKMLNDNDWTLDIFWAKEYTKKEKPTMDEKIKNTEFLIIRKPMTFLSNAETRKKIQNVVLKDKKNLLVMSTFPDRDSLDVLTNFLQPFHINPTDNKVIDNNTNKNNERLVVFNKKNKCFSHATLFKGVKSIVIPYPYHLIVDSPAEILIRGNPSTEVLDDGMDYTPGLKGSDIIVGAYFEASCRVIVVNSTIFLDSYFEFNRSFIKNIISWCGKGRN